MLGAWSHYNLIGKSEGRKDTLLPELILNSPIFVIRYNYKKRKPYFIKKATDAGFLDIRSLFVEPDTLLLKAKEKFNISIKKNGMQLVKLLSHLKAWKTFLKSGLPVATICEDNVFFYSNFKNYFPIFYNKTPSDYDIIFIGNNSYIITHDGAKKLFLHIKLILTNTPCYIINDVLIDYMVFISDNIPYFKWYNWEWNGDC